MKKTLIFVFMFIVFSAVSCSNESDSTNNSQNSSSDTEFEDGDNSVAADSDNSADPSGDGGSKIDNGTPQTDVDSTNSDDVSTPDKDTTDTPDSDEITGDTDGTNPQPDSDETSPDTEEEKPDQDTITDPEPSVDEEQDTVTPPVDDDYTPVEPSCGDGNLDSNEVCETGDSKSCIDINSSLYKGGTAECRDDCGGYDTSTCQSNASAMLFPVKKETASGKMWGYIDETGTIKIDLTIAAKSAYPFHEGLALVIDSDWNYNYIDTTGTYVIQNNYYTATSFTSEGFAAVQVDGFRGDWMFIDKTGNENALTTERFSDASQFSEGLAAVADSYGDYGFIDTDGNMAIDFSIAHVGNSSFSEGLCAVSSHSEGNNSWYYIDKEGNEAFVGRTFDKATDFSEGYAVVGRNTGATDSNGYPVFKYSYIDKSGAYLFDGKEFDYAGGFSQQLAVVIEGDKLGVIKKDGTYQIPLTATYEGGYYFTEDLLAVGNDSGWGYINSNNETVIDFHSEWYDVRPFTGNLALIMENNGGFQYGYVNKSGVIVWDPQ